MSDSKQITVTYYASLREAAGTNEERRDTHAGTASALYAELCDAHGFTLRPDQLRVAINDAFAEWDAPLKDGDRVVFIPPVAGG